jgi:hypothetical protein
MRIGDGLRIGVAGACATATLLLPTVATATETAGQSFTTAGEHTFVVPPAVTSVQVTLVGGYGGLGSAGAPGGIPATTSATLTVSPGETLYAEVAGNGESAEGLEDRGGYGGGGDGGVRTFLFASAPSGGGGGGASDVRTCAASASAAQCDGRSSFLSRLLVAGGGGGGGGNGLDPASTAGGVGGAADQSGSAGAHDAATDFGGGFGLRGSTSAGGAGGSPSGSCEPMIGSYCPGKGQLGDGGVGGEAGGGGGGGGGGIFGGGGGGAGEISNVGTPQSPILAAGGGGGGGGGSSAAPAGATGVSGFTLMPTAEGAVPSVSFSWTAPPPTVLTGAPSAVTSTTATLNGTVNPNAWQPTGCSFVLSPAPAGVSAFPCAQQLATGIAPTPVSATAAGLAPGTKYTVTLTASTVQGAGNGASVSFTTPSAAEIGKSGAVGGTTLSLTGLELSPTIFRHGKHLATIAKTKARKKKIVPTATTISFSLSEAATVTLSLEQSSPGVLSGHKCVMKPKAHRKSRSCTRYVLVQGRVSRAAHTGLDKIHFEGILDANKPLPTGTYRLSLKASNSGGSAIAPQHPTFTLTA